MTTKQKISLWATAGMLCFVLLFPPFIITGGRGNVIYSKHAFVTKPPQRHMLTGHIDKGTLAIEIIGVFLIGGLFFFIAKE